MTHTAYNCGVRSPELRNSQASRTADTQLTECRCIASQCDMWRHGWHLRFVASPGLLAYIALQELSKLS